MLLQTSFCWQKHISKYIRLRATHQSVPPMLECIERAVLEPQLRRRPSAISAADSLLTTIRLEGRLKLGKLTFVGLGLGDQGVSIGGVRAIKEADTAYLEYYTTPHEPRLLQELESAAGRTLTIVDRT